jgi:hypothetical protein
MEDDHQSLRAPPPPPPPPPELPVNLLHNLAALRSTYIGIFNQILDHSLNINCICKTTKETPPTATPASSSGHNLEAVCDNAPPTRLSSAAVERRLVFDQGNHFLSDDEDDDDENDDNEGNLVVMSDENAARPLFDPRREHDTDPMSQLSAQRRTEEIKLTQLDVESDYLSVNNCRINKICDLSCFENMKYIHFTLKNCFHLGTLEQSEAKFSRVWDSFKFLAKYPKSCDYYGTTIYHYAASDSDDNVNLLRCALQKYPVRIRLFTFFEIEPNDFPIFFF